MRNLALRGRLVTGSRPFGLATRASSPRDVKDLTRMEHRSDLEQILLAGLPEQDRRETVESIREETAQKLDRLRRRDEPAEIDLSDE